MQTWTYQCTFTSQDLPKNKELLLKKALYGTKSSGALYAKEIAKWFKEYCFEPCSVDETLFRLTRMKGNKKCTLLVSIYVDDWAWCTNDELLYQDFIKALGDKYELSDSGDLDQGDPETGRRNHFPRPGPNSLHRERCQTLQPRGRQGQAHTSPTQDLSHFRRLPQNSQPEGSQGVPTTTRISHVRRMRHKARHPLL